MAATTRTNYENFLKELYLNSVEAVDLGYRDNPCMAMLPKNSSTGGDKYIKPIRYAWGTGRSGSYASAHANVGPAGRLRWEMDWTNHYVKAAVENKAIELARGAGRAGAFRDLLVDEADWVQMAFANDVEVEIHQDGTGYRGKAAGAYGATVADAVQLFEGEGVNFNVGDIIQKFDTSADTLPAETRVITRVDRDNDVIYFASDFTVATDATPGDEDYFLLEGDSNKAFGFKAWLPGSAVTSDLFNGVNRTVDNQRLAGVDGVQGTAPGLLITDSFVQTGAKINKHGGRPNLVLTSPEDFADLALETEDRGRYVKVGATTGSVSFSALEIMLGSGACPVVPDRHTRSDEAFMLDTSKIELYSTNVLPSIFDLDGNLYHRTEDADEISFYSYGFYGISIPEPGHCSWIQDVY